MKLFLLFFSILIFQNYVSSEDEVERAQKLIAKFPKPNIALINSKRSFKKKPLTKLEIKKKDARAKFHTVFPPILPVKSVAKINVPDSPYFQNENAVPKNRIKKVLPEFRPGLFKRKKRSATENKKLKKLNSNSTSDAKSKTKKKPTNHVGKHAEKKSATVSVKPNHKEKAKHDKNDKIHNETIKAASSKPKKKQDNLKMTNNKDISYKQHIKETRIKKSEDTAKALRKGRRRSRKPKRAKRGHRKRKVKDGRRLIAARDANIEDYPYVVSIQKEGDHWCSGALLNPRIVITTANCVWKSNTLSHLSVRVSSRHADTGQTVKILTVMKHPSWSIRKSPDNDVALLLLDTHIKFSDRVHAADLPNKAMIPPFDDVWVTSWGAERRDGVYDPDRMTLQVYHARLMSPEKCNNITMRFGVAVTENFICVSQSGRRAPCTRDTGAPAVSDGVVWGLASWGIRKLCGTERFPAMFSYLGSQSNHDFIINGTKVLMSEARENPFLDRFKIQRQATSTTNVAIY